MRKATRTWPSGSAWIVVVACATAIAVWPKAREMLGLHARLVTGLVPAHSGYASPWAWHRDPLDFISFEPWLEGADETHGNLVASANFLWLAKDDPSIRSQALLASAVCHPHSPDRRSVENPGLAALVEYAPADPRTWAVAVYANLPRLPWPGEPSIGVEFRGESRRRLVEAITQGRDLDPGNGFWDLAEACQYVAAGDLEQAERALLRASAQPRFHDYRRELYDAVFEADYRLSGYQYRSSWVATSAIDVLTTCGNEVWRAPPQVFRHAAERERGGEAGAALRVYQAAFALDALLAAEPPFDPLGSRRPGMARRAWLERHEVLAEEPEASPDAEDRYDVWRAREARALASFQGFAESQGRPDLAEKARAAEERTTQGWRPISARIKPISELVWLAPHVWRLQMAALLLLACLAPIAVLLRLLAVRMRSCPQSTCAHVAVALAAAVAVLILSQTPAAFVGSLQMRCLTFGDPAGPDRALERPLSSWVPVSLVPAILAAALVFWWQRHLLRARAEAICTPSVAAAMFTEWLMAFAAIAYVALTAWQAAFQDSMLAILP
jgi:hypothetical protein